MTPTTTELDDFRDWMHQQQPDNWQTTGSWVMQSIVPDVYLFGERITQEELEHWGQRWATATHSSVSPQALAQAVFTRVKLNHTW